MSKTVFPQTVKPWVDEYEAKNDYLILDRSGVSIYVFIISFHGLRTKRHPNAMHDAEVEQFLAYLPQDHSVVMATQKVALNALAFLLK
jgi:hypothetical protein